MFDISNGRSDIMNQKRIDIGNRIKHYRELANMSQSELSQKVGFKNRSSMSAIESGQADIPSERFSKIARVLGVSESVLRYGEPGIDYIVEDDGNKIVITKEMLSNLNIDEISLFFELYNKCIGNYKKLAKKMKEGDSE